jgi:putative flippase GtrA
MMAKLHVELQRFAIVGLLAAGVHLAVVYAIVHFVHISPLSANLFGFLCAFSVSYTGHRYWTFYSDKQMDHRAVSRFFILASSGFVLNQCLYYLFYQCLHLNYLLALFFVIGIVAAVSFIGSKLWAFKYAY